MAFKNAVFKILAVVEKLVQVTFQCTEVILSQTRAILSPD